jgi:hypothetical protein
LGTFLPGWISKEEKEVKIEQSSQQNNVLIPPLEVFLLRRLFGFTFPLFTSSFVDTRNGTFSRQFPNQPENPVPVPTPKKSIKQTTKKLCLFFFVLFPLFFFFFLLLNHFRKLITNPNGSCSCFHCFLLLPLLRYCPVHLEQLWYGFLNFSFFSHISIRQ